MKRLGAVIAGTLLMGPLLAVQADNIIRTSAPIRHIESPTSPEAVWIIAEPSYSPWASAGPVSNCGEWLPSNENVDMDSLVTQSAVCEQTQIRSVQPREQQQGTQNYRNSGSAYEESQVVQVDEQRDARGAVARSCLMHKQYAGATADGIYSIKVQDRDVSVVCDMTGGGWTIVARGAYGSVGAWAQTREAINPTAVPGADASITARFSDSDINAIPKTVFKAVTTGYSNTRFFKGDCLYSSIASATGSCAISYATETWSSPRGNGSANCGGLCDHRASVSGDGLYVSTSASNSPVHGWAAGNGTIASNTGTGAAGTQISQYIYVK